jgi:hypothetical protein
METVSYHHLTLNVLRSTELSFQMWTTTIMFIFTMTPFSDKQEKAQQEIDTVASVRRCSSAGSLEVTCLFHAI